MSLEKQLTQLRATATEILPYVNRERLPSPINDRLVDMYGPCWGIEAGQCRE
jgi:hypothetical protein